MKALDRITNFFHKLINMIRNQHRSSIDNSHTGYVEFLQPECYTDTTLTNNEYAATDECVCSQSLFNQSHMLTDDKIKAWIEKFLTTVHERLISMTEHLICLLIGNRQYRNRLDGIILFSFLCSHRSFHPP